MRFAVDGKSLAAERYSTNISESGDKGFVVYPAGYIRQRGQGLGQPEGKRVRPSGGRL